jgi:outer membrane protein assembly factor BamB
MPDALIRFLLLIPLSARAADWPQFLGPQRDGRAPAEAPLVEDVPDDGFKVLWKHDCGEGFAGPVVKDGRVILFHRMKDQNVVEARDAVTGRELWRTAWETDYRDDFGFDAGPRSSPTLHGSGASAAVFCYGADGSLTALSLEDGKEKWRKDLVKELSSGKGFFGRAGAPLVAGDLVMVAAGGEGAGVAAFDRESGALRWKALDHEAGYASPILMRPPQGERAVFFTREGVAGLDPASGKVAWTQPFRAKMHASVNAASPVAVDSTHFFTSSCYDVGGALWEIGKDDKLTATWRAGDRLDCHYSTPVLVDGNLYGFHGRQETGQQLRCIAVNDGIVRWSMPLAAGHIIACGKRLVILTEDGELILTAASPDKAPSLSVRGEILRGGHRAPPALANGLLCAKDKSRLVCVDLRRQPAEKEPR